MNYKILGSVPSYWYEQNKSNWYPLRSLRSNLPRFPRLSDHREPDRRHYERRKRRKDLPQVEYPSPSYHGGRFQPDRVSRNLPEEISVTIGEPSPTYWLSLKSILSSGHEKHSTPSQRSIHHHGHAVPSDAEGDGEHPSPAGAGEAV